MKTILVLLVTDRMSGPAKQALQIYDNVNTDTYKQIMCCTLINGSPYPDFFKELDKRKIPLMILNQHLKYDPSIIWQAYRIVKKNKIDIIETHGYKATVIAFILKMLTGLPWLCFVHGWTAEDLKVKFYHKLDGYLLRFSDKIITVSDSFRNNLITKGIPSTKVITVHNALDPKEFIASGKDIRRQCGLSSEDIVIGVIGRLSAEKGQRFFLDAFKEIKMSIPDIKAFIIGEGPDMVSLKKYSCSLGLNGSVKFLGYQVDIVPFYKAIDLLVIPSFSEGLPNVLLEAMYFGKPVVATSVGGIPEVIKNNHSGIHVSPGDSGAMAREVIKILSNKKRMSLFVKNSKENILERFIPEKRARKILSIYKTLLSA